MVGFDIVLCLTDPNSSTAVYMVILEYSVVNDKYFFKLYIPEPVNTIF